MIVVDTCIIVHLYNETTCTAKAQELFAINPYWQVPSMWQEEYANVLAKLARTSTCTHEEVLNRFQYTVQQLQESQHELKPIEALEYAMRYQRSAYDAHFIALAEKLNTWLITEDKEVLQKCKTRALSIAQYIQKQQSKWDGSKAGNTFSALGTKSVTCL